MPDDNSDPFDPDEDPANPAEASKAEQQDAAAEPDADVGAALEALLAENTDLRDRLLRSMADMENLRKRSEREKADTARYSISNFARDVLTLGDNLKRVIDHMPAETADQDPTLKGLIDGVKLTERELLNMLDRHGVTRIEPLGQRFDPNSQQAMYEVPNAEVPDGTVVEVMQAGYLIGDRCLRPAMVAVAKGGTKPAPKPEQGSDPAGPADDDTPDEV